MATHIIHPRQFLDPDQLDAFLERGWRPTGQSIYTSDYLRTDDDELHGCLQIRLPLKGFTFKKRHRKLLRRNGKRFTAQYAKAGFPDQELLAVNRRYMADHPDKTREDLEYNVINEAGQQVLNTHILRIFEGEQLVAFSYFDMGQRVIYAKAGIYDPRFASASLGLYTMLLEVQHALDLGFTHYYPGYYSPTFSAFDYKLRLGPMEYRDISAAEWRPHSTDPVAQPEDPLHLNREMLREAREALLAAGVRAEFREYPSFTGRFRPVQQGENVMLDAPQLLLIGRPLPLEFYFVLTYDNEVRRYRFDVVRTANLYDMRVQILSRQGVPRFTTPVVVHNRIVESERLSVIIRKVRERLAGTSPS
ncbi:GNAT family N-acetyltransferase [Lewinella sp. IMCC34191]|uniref:GNAT family N-acetyltransferase n=1 Tax=Lewinella sp. IMCC34191 TaxID=2259172 RepID=UPI001300BA99|nr:GNAT family N-acetyltransferase [Lewinella sp. IMCC34191]